MNTVTVLDLQMQALLDRLAREQATRTERARDDAAAQARDIVRHARAEARARLHEAVQETRREHAVALQRRRAALATRRRQQHQARLRRWLEDAWQRLPAALESRWNDRSQREAWCRAACQQALRSLVHTTQLVVRIDARWRDEVRPAIERDLPATVGGTLEIVPVDGLGPGLVVCGGHALVDATLPGLLAARESITAALLAQVEATAGSDRGETP
jgi:vacuolar-type H+-ATPase subunit E/Vma4